MLDIHTVGAGGGSIARFDAAGALRVGPESAGADPGPICYGKGLLPTVTDANLILGRLQPHRFLGGEFRLDPERTRRVVKEWLGKQRSGLSLEQFATGVIRIVNSNMEKALRVVSIERGHDPRRFALFAFGGAGGLHACELAQALGIPRVVVPAMPGGLSAFGILVSDVVKDYSRTVLWRVAGKVPFAELEKEFSRLSRSSQQDFRAEGWAGGIREHRSADLRYRGQGYELNIPLQRSLLADFHAAHARRYGYSHPGREVELVTLRLRATVKSPQARVASRRGDSSPAAAKLTDQSSTSRPERLPVIFSGKKLTIAIYERNQLAVGKRYSGPAVITEYSATTVVPPGMRFWADAAGSLLVNVR
jgi:N-methylhydantoinase A